MIKKIFLTKDTTNSKIITKDDWIEVYQGTEYKAILKVEANGDKYKGTLKIIKDNKEIEFGLKGISGC